MTPPDDTDRPVPQVCPRNLLLPDNPQPEQEVHPTMPAAIVNTDAPSIQSEGADLFDEMTIAALASVDPTTREQYRAMFAQGYLQGYGKGQEYVVRALAVAQDVPLPPPLPHPEVS